MKSLSNKDVISNNKAMTCDGSIWAATSSQTVHFGEISQPASSDSGQV